MLDAWKKVSSAMLGQPVRGMTIGHARDFFAADPATDQAMSDLSQLGMSISVITLPDYAVIEAAGITILQYQALALHRDRMTSGLYGQQARATLLSGPALDRARPYHSMQVATDFRMQMTKMLSRHAAIATVCVLSTAPPLCAVAPDRAVWTTMRTLPFNMSGHPILACQWGSTMACPWVCN
jgi:aspartyl-tRNA(Asn)/glutamyl-tRNA(Gln) amidotransferase subunit A